MSRFLRYPLVLGIVAAASGLALYGVYAGTQAAMERQAAMSRRQALGRIFLDGFGATEEVKDGETVLFTKVWKEDAGPDGTPPDTPPAYYAIAGSAVGYNASTPVRLLVGFTHPKPAPPEAQDKKGLVLVGWSVLESEETPGLGENIKNQKAANSLAAILTGQATEPPKDRRTDFQKQFADPEAGRVYTPDELALAQNGGPIDAITGATITSRAVVNAIKDAARNLRDARGAVGGDASSGATRTSEPASRTALPAPRGRGTG